MAEAEARPQRPWRPLLALAAVCTAPLALTQPGWISADTKTYLYLDPGRLMGRAWSMWDPLTGLGTVSHQTIGYLWPMGPWYWLAERVGIPDWLAQRMWWAAMLTVAGAGVAHLLRRFRWPSHAVWAAAFVYALSPYVMTHIGRLSAVLLPFVGLPWLMAFTIDAMRHRGWRHPALFALTVATVGSVNLTALALAGVGPLLWVVYAILSRQATLRTALVTTAKIGVLTLIVNAWWLAGLWVQAGYGLDIVRYTETAEVVASASTAGEVIRGLGYWFFYGGDQLELWVAAGGPYTQQLWLLAVTFAVPTLALLAARSRWTHRTFFVVILVVGSLLAIGGHPWSSPPPLGRAIKAFLATERGLAFRSLPRAVPLVALALAVLIGAGLVALARRHRSAAAPLAVLTCGLAVAALPPLWQGSMVSEQLRMREVPDHWLDAAHAISTGDDGTRVLELPGIDFAHYRWGTTVDPITPGLTDRPYVAREHVPFGSAASANLLNALDVPLQERTLDPDALAPLARLMRAGDIVVRSDLEYERFNTARPRLVWDLIRRAAGLGEPAAFGPDSPNEPGDLRQLEDEAWLVREAGLADPPAVAVVPVDDPVPVLATKSAARPVVIAGDGSGVVDAASAGLIDGHELILYSAALGDADLADALDAGGTLVLTDTNRNRGERWNTVRHNYGYTEPTGQEPVREDPTDNRLPVFPDAGSRAQTVALHRGGITANATSYGNPIALIGEHRPAGAIDGDPSTSWQTGGFTDARGEQLVITLDEPETIDRVRLLQPQDGKSNRVLTRVSIRIDDGPATTVDLDESSLVPPGQLVELPATEGRSATITLVADSGGNPPRFAGLGSVGFAEVSLGDTSRVLDEVIRLPEDLLGRAGAESAEQDLVVLLTRIRQDPTDTTREDEERAMHRTFHLPTPRTFQLSGVARLSARASAALLDEILGQARPGLSVTASSNLEGAPGHRPIALVDGDPATAWASDFDDGAGTVLRVHLPEPTAVPSLDLSVVRDSRYSVPTQVSVRLDGRDAGTFDLAPPDAPAGTVDHLDLGDDGPVTEVEIEITAVEPRTSVDWNTGGRKAHPVSISGLGLALTGPASPTIDTGCRSDLLTVQGRPFPLRLTGSTQDALAGRPLAVEGCEPLVLDSGEQMLRTEPGLETGLDLDRLVLADRRGPVGGAPPRGAEILEQGPDHVRADIAAPGGDGGWLILGQSLNRGWSARLTTESGTVDLGEPQLVDGFANGWRLPDGFTEGTVDLRFEPQRTVNLALLLSVGGAVLALLLLLRRPTPLPSPPAVDRGARTLSPPVAVALSAVVALLVLPPVYAPGVAIVVAAASRFERLRTGLRLAPAVLVGITGLYTVVWQARYRILPGLEWPAEVSDSHHLVVLALVLLVVDLLLPAPPGERSTEGPG